MTPAFENAKIFMDMKVHNILEKETNIEDFAKLFAGLIAGFSFFIVSSYQKSPVKKLPERKIKNVSYFPNIKIQKKDGHYHIHHWIILSALYAPFILAERLRSKFLHGFLIGSIVQGLTYKDRFQIKYHSKAQTQ